MQPLGNGDGIFIPAGTSNVAIGGTDSGSRNVISANLNGIEMQGDANFGVVVEGNYIGTDMSGSPTLGNRREGIGASSNLLIGGMEAGAGNLIAGNGDSVGLYGSNDQVIGNVIRNNSGAGVGSRGTNNQIIGNVIHDNGAAGIQINGGVGAGLPANDYAQGNTVSANSIYANGGLGIDLQTSDASHLFTGVTLNDSMGHDGNDGPNHFQNFPNLAGVTRTAGGTTVTGTLSQAVTPDTRFRIEFFANHEADPSGYGEGQRHLGLVNVTTDADGNTSISVNLPALRTGEGFVTATATNLATGDTSEFSQAIAVPIKATPTVTVSGGSFIYDGNPHSATGSVTGVNGENLGTPTFNYSYTDDNGHVVTLAGPPVDPGYYTVTASFAGNANYDPATATATITIAFEVHTLTDLSKAFHPGRTIPIKIQLLDASGNDISSSGIDLTALRLERQNADGSVTVVSLQDAGNSNPDNLFRYDAALGGYIFNLSTKDLGAGTYDFYWMADGDPTEHKLVFWLN
jgi:hypothetical protein